MKGVRWVTLAVALLSAGNVWSFQLSNIDGERDELKQYTGSGKWTLVMLWSLDCVPCEQQKPMIQAFHDEHSNSKARVIGLALDGLEHRAAIQKRIAKHNTSYTNLLAFSDVISKQLLEETGRGIVVTPSYLLYRPDGSYFGVHTGMLHPDQLAFMTK